MGLPCASRSCWMAFCVCSRLYSFSFSSRSRLIMPFIDWSRVSSLMPNRRDNWVRYSSRNRLSSTTEILFTIPPIASERFTGSLTFSTVSLVLNEIKSSACSSIYALNSWAVCLRENESGSSPSGSNSTFTFMPSANSISVPRMAAWIPASSPSYSRMMLGVNRRRSFI